MKAVETRIRVTYADTDQMGMVYYANYLTYFERGRTEWMRESGMPYRELEGKGLYFPVMECRCSYLAPAKYDDLLDIITTVAEVGPASVTFAYKISCEGKLLAEGTTKHPLVNDKMKPVRMPAETREILKG